MPFEEVVEAEGHLIDSHIMENIFDKVVEHDSRFEVEQFRIGRTNSEPSYLRLRVTAPERVLSVGMRPRRHPPKESVNEAPRFALFDPHNRIYTPKQERRGSI